VVELMPIDLNSESDSARGREEIDHVGPAGHLSADLGASPIGDVATLVYRVPRAKQGAQKERLGWRTETLEHWRAVLWIVEPRPARPSVKVKREPRRATIAEREFAL
jgi:hypothetical protein